MTIEQANATAARLKDKAQRLLAGEYGPDDAPGSMAEWAADLCSAAAKLESGREAELMPREREEIESLD